MEYEENYLYDWGGAEAWWLEDSSVCGVTSGVAELTLGDGERVLDDTPPLAGESTVTSGAPDILAALPPSPRHERSRNRLISGAIGCVTLLIAAGSVAFFSENGGQKKASSTKTEQYVNPPASKVIIPATEHGILPPADPPANIAPSPNFLKDCQNGRYDDSKKCVRATLSAIDNARAMEGTSRMELPSNWYALTPAEQLFVATNLERTDRGLPPLTERITILDQVAAKAAERDVDPSLPSGFPPSSHWGSNWAGSVGNPLEAVYYWMYDDGSGSANFACTATNPSGCWGHRNNMLLNLPHQPRVMGTAFKPTAYQGEPSLVEILVGSSG